MWRRVEVRSVAFLGAGGVGKTTYIYRVLGLSKAPRLTRRPYTYFLSTEVYRLYLVDTPGQYAVEVAKRFLEAMKSFGARIDLVVYMYSVVDSWTLDALLEIHEWVRQYPATRRILVGNKRDLGEELGIFVEGDDVASLLGVSRVYYTSALRDEAEDLLLHIVENL